MVFYVEELKFSLCQNQICPRADIWYVKLKIDFVNIIM